MAYNRGSILSNMPPVTKNLLIINVLMWLATMVFGSCNIIDLQQYLGLHFWLGSDFNPVQLVTYMFMHDTHSIWHLFCNMFGVYMFGIALEQIWGSKKFLLYYMVSGVGAAIVQQLCWMGEFWSVTEAMNAAIAQSSPEMLESVEPTLRHFFRFGDINALRPLDIAGMREMLLNLPVTVGASGALFGVLLAFGWLFPDVKMFLLFVPIPIPARIFVGLYAVMELFLGVAGFSFDNVAHFAHLGGMIFGLILLLIWRKKGTLYR